MGQALRETDESSLIFTILFKFDLKQRVAFSNICERGHMNLITLAFIAEPIFRSASRVYGRCRNDSGGELSGEKCD